ncbi:MAG: DUF748 domain-containing protein [Colwellia sp.]
MSILLSIYLGVFLIIWAISSPVSKYFIEPELAKQGLTLSKETSLTFNPFLSQLTVTDLALYTHNEHKEKVFEINKAVIRLTLIRLIFDEIFISQFSLDGGFLNVKHTSEQLIIAGIDLNKKDNKNTQNSEKNAKNDTEYEAEDDAEKNSSSFAYQVILPELDFSQIDIDISTNTIPHHLKINSLVVENLIASEQAQQAQLSLQTHVDSSPITLNADLKLVQGEGDINSKLAIKNYPLNKLTPYVKQLSALSGLFSFSSEQKISLSPAQLSVHVKNAKMSNKALMVEHQQQILTLENLQQTITDLMLTIEKDTITKISGTSQLELNQASLQPKDTSQIGAAFQQFSVNDISFHLKEYPTIKIASLVIDNISASKNEALNLAPLAQLQQFSMSDILVNEKQIALGTILIDTLESNIIVNKKKMLERISAQSTSTQATSPQSPSTKTLTRSGTPKGRKAENEAASDMSFSVKEISLVNGSKTSFIDNSVTPVYKRFLFIDKLHLGTLSNAIKAQKTPFEIIGRSNKYANFNFHGFTQPFTSIPTHHIEGFLKEVSLPAISSYTQAMKLELKSGQFGTDLNATLTGDKVSGDVVLKLHGLETAIADNPEVDSLIDQGALPLNMAINILKDSDGNVELGVPLSGSTSDPQFGLSSIVTLITQKVIWSATQDYLMKTFVPYANIVSVAMTVGELALKLRFDDLPYQAKQIAPNENQQAYLQSFIALMQNKEDTRVKLCAISTPKDLETSLSNSASQSSGQEITDEKAISQLKAIAEQREHALKSYLIEHGKIDSARLLLCTPKIDSDEEAQPRIEISV